ncbi:MAG: SDR family oxidoreductase [Desulfobacteraceae bacterium]|jgi:dTDP-4-dehydrorhamnose reductase
MRILILGGDGMLGHRLFKDLKTKHEVRVTLRQPIGAYAQFGLFDEVNAYADVDVRSLEQLLEVLTDFRPVAVVNAVGVVKQRAEANESIPSLEINSLFPHRLAVLCEAINSRLLHLSTDCVFSGKKGNYLESDPFDAEDLYGCTKYLGEVKGNHCLTLRTSMIGRELSRKMSLLEWFLSQKKTIKGYTHAIFSGFTTQELSRIIEMLLVKYPEASGLYHVSSDPISKYDLLMLIKEKLGLAIEIIPDPTVQCDRSLNSSKFRQEFKYTPPIWREMVAELCMDLSTHKEY